MNDILMDRFFDLTLALLCTARREGNAFENLNPAWERTLGWTREELCSRSFTSFIHPEDLQRTFDVISKMDEGAPAVHFENRYLHKDGSWVWLSWVSVLDTGTFYAAAIDVTAYKMAEENLNATNAELKHFAYGASHDLREPLRGILGHLALVDSSPLDASSAQSLDYVRKAAQQMQQFLDGIMSYSRVAGGASKTSRVSMAKVLQDAMTLLDAAIRESNASVQTEGLLPSLLVDPAQMTQVFQNLLGNAVKYRAPGKHPTIVVRCRKVGGGWCFDVEDDGVGFDAKYAEKAWLIFQRLHPPSEYGGTGIGLALVRRIVNLHNGRTGIRSEPGKGTTAWFWLPGGDESS